MRQYRGVCVNIGVSVCQYWDGWVNIGVRVSI